MEASGIHECATAKDEKGLFDMLDFRKLMVIPLIVLLVAIPTGHSVLTVQSPKRTVFLIVMENRNWSDIKGNPSAPYLNSLLSLGAHAEQYYNPPRLHPSEPNYIWLEAGDNLGIHSDADPERNHRSTSAHLVNLLEANNISWKSYQESIEGDTCALESEGTYAAKHNPMVFFDDVTNNNDPQSSRCIEHIRPYSELASDLTSGTTAQYNFLTPNLCHDMHGDLRCLTGNFNLIKEGDNWLASELPQILTSTAYQNGGVVFITWDEASRGDGPIGMIVLSPDAKVGYANQIHYTHSSTLRSIEELFGVEPYLGDAANAQDLSDLFLNFP